MISDEDKEIFRRIKEKSLLKTPDLEKNWQIFEKMKQVGEEISFSDFLVKRKVLTSDVLEESQVANTTRKKLGSYELLSKLGSGGMGTVYLARKDNQKVAIKLLPKSKNADEKAIKRFNREFKTLNELEHKNIIRAIERGFADSYNYYVMEYFESESLKDYGLSHSAVEKTFFLPLILQIAEALQYSSNKGILHRDIKPDNILVTKDSVAKIIDFGLVKWEGQDVTALTRTQSTMGTPHFISPEQAKDSKNIDERADIYSLGASYYNMLTNDFPFKGNTPYEILSALLSKDLEEPKELNPDIPDNVNALILKMMAKNIEERYLNWQEVIADINKCLKGQKVAYKKNAPASRTNKVYVFSGVSLLFVLGLAYLFFGLNSKEGGAVAKDSPSKENLSENILPPVENGVPEVKNVPYRIATAFDRQHRRSLLEKNALPFFKKLDEKIKWLASQDIDTSAPFQEQLIAIGYQTLALTGDGQDFFTSPYKNKLVYNEKFILDSQLSPGRWSSDIGINALCSLTVVEMFAMHGSTHEELDRIIPFCMANLHKDLDDDMPEGFKSAVDGSELLVMMAFIGARHCGSKKDTVQFPKEFHDFLLLEANAENLKEKELKEQLYWNAISKWLSRSRDNDDQPDTLGSIKNENNVINMYNQSIVLFRSFRQNGTQRFVRAFSENELMDQVHIENQFGQFSKKNGAIITNGILILSYENLYRYPVSFVLQNDIRKMEERFRELRRSRNPRSSRQ